MILEVGLGGRLDAVNAVDADCALITSIDLDHMDYLGPDRESIGFEKAGILRAGKPAVVSDPVPPASVLRHAQAIGADLWLVGPRFQPFRATGSSGPGLGAAGATTRWPIRRCAARTSCSTPAACWRCSRRCASACRSARRRCAAAWRTVELAGRFQIVPGQPALVLDVAHNPQAAAALAFNLDQMGFFPRTHAVFGAMHDKDIPGMLSRLAPLVDRWYLCDLPLPRAATAQDLAAHGQGGSCAARRGTQLPRIACRRAARRPRRGRPG